VGGAWAKTCWHKCKDSSLVQQQLLPLQTQMQVQQPQLWQQNSQAKMQHAEEIGMQDM